MSGSVNKANLVGHVGQDPETRTFDDGNMQCQFSVATSESWKDKKGEWQEHTIWHRIVTKGKTAEYCSKNIRKGRLVYIEGKIVNRSYPDPKTQETKYVSEIVVGPYKGEVTKIGPDPDGSKKDSPPPKDQDSGSSDPDQDIPF
jgi:single-strand DNA-binding protein